MEERHEIIHFDSENPVKIFMHKLGDVSRHWHESIELLFVLAGTVNIFYGDKGTVLKKDDILLINSNTIHELHSDDCVLIALQVKLDKFGLNKHVTQNLYFDCDSTKENNPEQFIEIKRIISSILHSGADKNEMSIFRNRSLAFLLLSELVENFKTVKPSYEQGTEKYLERLTEILEYINEHYQEQITLNSLSDAVHLSSPYLSTFFEKYMGVNFSTYYTDLRLEKATGQLLRTDESIESVAIENGFADPRSFTRAFRKKYNMLPSEYRKTLPDLTSSRNNEPLLAINYLDFKPENYLRLLSEYLPSQSKNYEPRINNGNFMVDAGKITLNHKNPKTLTHKWKNIACVGKAKDLLNEEIRNMLIKTQKEIGFKFIRFHGIFADDMLVCKRNENGSLSFSFVLVDKIFDFLMETGIKPLVQFSFMPKALALNPQNNVFDGEFIISPPKDYKEWELLIDAFMEHIINRYGLKEISSWIYTVWNEPDTSEKLFGFKDNKYFYRLYDVTWKAVKRYNAEIKVGSPSLFLMGNYGFNWLLDFLNYTKKEQCLPDFIDGHFYSNDFSTVEEKDISFMIRPISNDPDFFKKYIDKFYDFIKETEYKELPFFISEWNLTTSHRNLINDTCFKGCYVAKNYLENYDRVEAIGYWSLTDLTEESQLATTLFHGGMGLFTNNAIPKPSFYVMKMMTKLGNKLLKQGEGYFVTCNENNDIQMILYNYEHCNPFFAEEGFGITETNRDDVFVKKLAMNFSVQLNKVSKGNWKIRETIINKEHGSCFDNWVDMGAKELSAQDSEYLLKKTEPKVVLSEYDCVDETINYDATLLPQEVRLVQFYKR